MGSARQPQHNSSFTPGDTETLCGKALQGRTVAVSGKVFRALTQSLHLLCCCFRSLGSSSKDRNYLKRGGVHDKRGNKRRKCHRFYLDDFAISLRLKISLSRKAVLLISRIILMSLCGYHGDWGAISIR